MTDEERRAIEWDCTKLINLYMLLNDAADWDGVAALYTEDGAMSRPSAPDNFVAGREAIRASFKARPPRPSRHVVSNVVVNATSPTEATAQSVLLLFTGEAQEGGALPVRNSSSPAVGFYHDKLVKTSQGWRFAVRRGGLDFAL